MGIRKGDGGLLGRDGVSWHPVVTGSVLVHMQCLSMQCLGIQCLGIQS